LISGSPFAPRSLAFVMVDIGGGVNISAQTAMGRLVDDADSLRNFVLYSSYGRQDISAQVFGPIAYQPSGCDTSAMANAMRPQIQRHGTFQHYLWYYGSPNQACPWAGTAKVGSVKNPQWDSWYNASTSCVALGMEPAHNFGQQHSSSLRCADASFADDPNACTSSEYGDVFDVMGNACRHPNAWQKAYRGWFSACNGVSVSASGTFTILPLEQRCDGPQFLKIRSPKPRAYHRPAAGGAGAGVDHLDYYYVELRTPRDFDGLLGGAALTPRVLVHVGDDLGSPSRPGLHTYLLDMTPETLTFEDAALAQGQTFTDPATGLSITARAVSATQATIVVESTSGTDTPTCLDGSPFIPPGPGPEACVENPPAPL
jgi:hypothetical protein